MESLILNCQYGWRNTLSRDKIILLSTCSLTMCATDLVNSGRIVECLEFILNVFFSDLETVMSGVMEAMMIIEERCE